MFCQNLSNYEFQNRDYGALTFFEESVKMDPEEVEFLAEKNLISIIPTFNSGVVHLIAGDIGPFRASLPVNVPLWVAVHLKQQQKCKIQPPDWVDVEKLEQLKEDEKVSR